MLNPYYYLFYRLYKRQRTKFGEFESAFAATTAMSSLLFINIYTIEIFFEKFRIIRSLSISITFVVSFILLLIAANFSLFYIKKRYERIESYFDNRKVNFGLVLIISYVIISFVAFFYAVNV
jgi:hypothetical protein